MILYDLRCAQDHLFEAWFRDSAAYDAQAGAGVIACPLCGDTDVTKAPMAPRLATRSSREEREAEPAAPPKHVSPPVPDERLGALMTEARRVLGKLREHVESNCDYVGDKFAEEARKIHYGETDPRGIYGEASPDQARELAEEGIEIARIPWLPRQDS